MIKLLHLITRLQIGGAQTALLGLLSKMDRNRFAIIVACLHSSNEVIARQIHELGIDIIDLRTTRKWQWDAFARMYRLFICKRPHILHTWLFHANIPGRILGRLAKVPIVITSERIMGETKKRCRLNYWTAPLVDRVIC